jgi:hypothetical protein
MKSGADVVITDNLKMTVHGMPFTGKTSALETFPRDKGIYVFDFDNKLHPILHLPNLRFDTYSDMDIRQPMAFKQAQTTLETMTKNAKEKGYVWLPEPDGKEFRIDLVVLDSATELQKIIMNHVLFLGGRPGTIPQVGDRNSNDYSTQKYALMYFVARVLALPCSVLLNCHERLVEDEAAQAKMMLPDLVSNLKTAMGGMFQINFRSETRQTKMNQPMEYLWLTRNTGKLQAGHVFKDSLDQFEPQNFKVIYDKIHKWDEKRKAESAKGIEGKEGA